MLIHPWDRGNDDEWRSWLAGRDFGVLAANGVDGGPPVLVPTHYLFLPAGPGPTDAAPDAAPHAAGTPGAPEPQDRSGTQDTVLLHLARPNPVWAAIEANHRLTLAVTDDYAFVRGDWRPQDGASPEDGVPTSYYTSVQLLCTATVVDDPEEKAALLHRQFRSFQPDTRQPPIVPGQPPYGRMLSSIRGLRLRIDEVRPKFKYDDKRTAEVQTEVAERLRERALPRDAGARTQLLRRRDARTDARTDA